MSHISEEVVATARSRALHSFAAMRAYRARFYREYMAVRPSPAHDGVCEATMPVEVQTLGPGGLVAPSPLATLADIALGTAIRSLMDPRRRTATAGLTLQVVHEAPAASVHARAEVVSMTDHLGLAQCRVASDRGELLALATGAFALRAIPENSPWLLYSGDRAGTAAPPPPVAPEDLSGEEEWLLGRVEESLRADDPDGPYTNFLGIQWQSRGSGQSLGIWPLGPHVWNRSGVVQGGATFGALAAAAVACLPPHAAVRLVEQHVQFVRPGEGKALRVTASMLRRGARLISVQAAITDEEGCTIAASLATLEDAASPGGDP